MSRAPKRWMQGTTIRAGCARTELSAALKEHEARLQQLHAALPPHDRAWLEPRLASVAATRATLATGGFNALTAPNVRAITIDAQVAVDAALRRGDARLSYHAGVAAAAAAASMVALAAPDA
jgi:hypothetical protein